MRKHSLESGDIKKTVKRHHKGSSIRKVRFDQAGNAVTIAKTVKVYDLASEKTIHTLKRDDDKTSTFYSVLPLAHELVCAGDDDGHLVAWDTRTPEKPVFSAHDCEQYISDMDGRHEGRRLLVCTSGEGTLTAYDMRAHKMIEPQSELFETGFQCVRLVESTKKVVIGGEDGAVYVFNQNEWGHTSGKFAFGDDLQNRGKCSIDCMDMLSDECEFLLGCSDGKLRSIGLWPHRIFNELTVCKRASIEAIHVNPRKDRSELVVCGENHLNIISFVEKDEENGEAASEDSNDDDDDDSATTNTSQESSSASSHTAETGNEADKGDESEQSRAKRQKISDEDYLNIFK